MSTQLHLRHIYTRWAVESVTIEFTLNWILVTPICKSTSWCNLECMVLWNTFYNETGLYF